MSETETRELSEELEAKRQELLDFFKEKLPDSDERVEFTPEEKAEREKREAELAEKFDKIVSTLDKSKEVEELEQRIKDLEAEPISSPLGIQTKSLVKGEDGKTRLKTYREWRGDAQANFFSDLRNDNAKTQEFYNDLGYTEHGELTKAWAQADLEDASLILPEVQPALPFLAHEAMTERLCTHLRISSPSVEFPVYTSGLTTAAWTDAGTSSSDKTASEPDFDLISANAYWGAGVTKVPNGLLDDYPAARGWITQELGRSAGALRNNWVLNGSGSGQPTGIYTNGSIPISNATGTTGRKIIEAIFGAIQHVRGNGFTQPTDIVLNPAVWTKIFLAWEDNIGYLFGTPGTNDVAPRGEVTSRLFGIPVTQDYYVTTAYGGTASSVSPVVVGNFRDAIVLDRMPFRIDVDTSVGFLKNYSIFRGEFRMGFLVVRPLSFEKVSNIVAT